MFEYQNSFLIHVTIKPKLSPKYFSSVPKFLLNKLDLAIRWDKEFFKNKVSFAESPLFTGMAETANNPAPARAPEAVTTVTIPEEKGAKLEALPAPAPKAKNIPEEKAIIMTTEKAAPALSINALRAKSLSGILAMISFIVSLPILASVIWLLYMRDYDCENLLRLPRLQTGIGIALLFMFIISTAALFLRPKFPMPGFLLAVVPLLVMLTVGLALLGAYDMESRKILASPRWFKLKVDNPNNWNNIKSCIYDTKICDDLFLKSLTVKSYDFTMKKLSPIEVIYNLLTLYFKISSVMLQSR